MKLDSVIVWANLIVLILLLLKFASKPFIDFIKGRKSQRSDELSRLASEKERISGELGDALRLIGEKEAFLAETEENIIREAEKIKFVKIREAESESSRIIEKAARGAEQELRAAAEKFRAEIINEMLNNPKAEKKE